MRPFRALTVLNWLVIARRALAAVIRPIVSLCDVLKRPWDALMGLVELPCRTVFSRRLTLTLTLLMSPVSRALVVPMPLSRMVIKCSERF